LSPGPSAATYGLGVAWCPAKCTVPGAAEATSAPRIALHISHLACRLVFKYVHTLQGHCPDQASEVAGVAAAAVAAGSLWCGCCCIADESLGTKPGAGGLPLALRRDLGAGGEVTDAAPGCRCGGEVTDAAPSCRCGGGGEGVLLAAETGRACKDFLRPPPTVWNPSAETEDSEDAEAGGCAAELAAGISAGSSKLGKSGACVKEGRKACAG
jgi:hypothetical protein